jgi:hypothetical protein
MPHRIQERIHAKKEKLQAYTQHLNEVWLLIVADDRTASQKFSPLDFPSNLISSRFSRTFYFYYSYGADCSLVAF